jgi:hypothetical protein
MLVDGDKIQLRLHQVKMLLVCGVVTLGVVVCWRRGSRNTDTLLGNTGLFARQHGVNPLHLAILIGGADIDMQVKSRFDLRGGAADWYAD